MSYADITFNDPNPIKRGLQKIRVRHSLRAIASKADPSILDYGAGNGELCKLIAQAGISNQITCYEPAPELNSEAQKNLASSPQVKVISNLSTVGEKKYDYIFCLEVFEHLPPAQTQAAIEDFKKLMAPQAKVVIGVPNELFLVGLVKGLFRMIRRPHEYDGNIWIILRATLGLRNSNRPTAEIGKGLPYYPYHTGFDYRELEKNLRLHFKVEQKYASPFRYLPIFFNSERYFVLS